VIANAVSRNVDFAIFAIENFFWPRDPLIERRRQRNHLKR
jgi:hypothetical protein